MELDGAVSKSEEATAETVYKITSTKNVIENDSERGLKLSREQSSVSSNVKNTGHTKNVLGTAASHYTRYHSVLLLR